ncbi:hypothetical protein IC621_05995 [Bacillus sp. IB182487]|uniref:Uncharacterized protein n=1 Tax=Metabacillus arenae TaxID=2771434 RepID=A0A926NGV4_9BACI|nr:hypothetical protein [Metabacillus arenae]
MSDFKTLKFLDKFNGLFERFGIDYVAMRRILQVKLTMDQRRVPTIFTQNTAKKKQDENQFIKSLWIYGLFGLFLIPFILLGDNYLFQMSITFGVVMFIIMTSMISDFSTVLLDIRDKMILQTKPLGKRTVNAARIIHITIYMSFLTGSLTAIPLAVSLFRHGFSFFLLFLIELMVVNLFIVVITAISYIAILKLFDGEKLKDMINYVQILLSIALLIGYQFVARSFEFVDLDVVFQLQWWQFFIPPVWFAAPYEWLLHGNNSFYMIAFSILALVVPFLSIFVYIKLIPSFERNLQKLSNQGAPGKKGHNKLRSMIANTVCRSKEETCFFHFASLMMKNERQFKLKVYPSLGFSLAFPFIFMFNELREKPLSEMASTNSYFSIYFAIMMIPSVVFMLQYSGTYKGAWVFITTPIQEMSSIYKGTLKAFLVKLFLPVYLVLSAVYIGIFTYKVIPDLIIVFISACVYTMLCFKALFNGELPFAESFEVIQQSDGWKVFALIMMIALFAGIHFVSTIWVGGVYIYLILLVGLNFFLWKKGFSQTAEPK